MKNISTLILGLLFAASTIAQVQEVFDTPANAFENVQLQNPGFNSHPFDSILRFPGLNTETLLMNVNKMSDDPLKEIGGGKTTNQQILTAKQGWSGLSSFVVPDNPDIETLFSPLQDNLIILYNLQGTYLPSQGVNTLGNWDSQSGYVAKFNQEANIQFSGQLIENGMLSLDLGWNLIPVLSTCPVDVETFFANQQVVVVREVAGWKLFWPALGINTLDSLYPGKAYFVKMNSPAELTFPACENLPPEVPSSPTPQDGSLNQPLSVTVSWLCADPENNPLTFDLYFGTTNPPDIMQTGIIDYNFVVSQLEQSTTYFWKIVAHDSYGNSSESPVWNLTTLEESVVFSCGDLLIDSRDGQEYETVQIVDQCWMAENLNIGTRIDGSEDMEDNGTIEKYCYDDDLANCLTYGGLYQWNETMQYVTLEGAKGICPKGWHVPTDNEWKIIEGNVDSQYPVGDPEWEITGPRGFDAGLNIKSTSGWINNGNGADLYGFKVLAAGYRFSDGSFFDVGNGTALWSSNETSVLDSWYRFFLSDFNGSYREYYFKNFGFSIRCLMNSSNLPPLIPSDPIPGDDAENQSIETVLHWSCTDREVDPLSYDVYFSTSNPPVDLVSVGQAANSYYPGTLECATEYFWQIIAHDDQGNTTIGPVWSFTTEEEPSDFICGEILVDTRNGHDYETVQIGYQCWMAENLNIGIRIDGISNQTDNGTIEKYCYNNEPGKCSQYGGLYQWDELMAYDSVEYTQGICPEGWHLPNDAEWQTLFDLYGGTSTAGDELVISGFSGFDALMNGQFNTSTSFSGINNLSTFWSATGIPGAQASGYNIATGSAVVNTGSSSVSNGFGVRCLKGLPNRVDPSVKVIDTTVYRLISDSLELAQGIYRYEVIGSRKAKDLIVADNILIGTVNDGYLRKVDEAVISGNEMTLTTSDATLEDVFVSGEFGFSSELTGKGEPLLVFTRVVYLAPGVEIRPSEDGFTYTFSNVILYQGGNASAIIPQGSFSFDPNFIFNLKFDKNQLKLLHCAAQNTTISNSLDVTFSVTGQTSGQMEKKVASIKKYFVRMVGIVPVLAIINIDLKVKINFSTNGDVNVTIGYTNTNSLSFGVKYENDQWQHIWNISESNQIHPVIWNSTNQFEKNLIITPEISVKFYGVAGPYFNLPLWEKLTADLALPAYDYDVGIDVGVNGKLGAYGEIFGKTIFNYNKQLFGFPKNLYNTPAKLEMVSGDRQTGQLNTQLPEPLKVKVTDNLGNTWVPARVHFTVETGGGSVSEADVWTDSDGFAETLWTLGGEQGVQTVKAKVLKANGANITGSPIEFKTNVCGLPFTDARDGKSYNTAQIGDQCWMSENLEIDFGNNWWPEWWEYENGNWVFVATVYNYGRLYDWNSALPACPSGWHLPSDTEWTNLTNYVSSQPEYLCDGNPSYIAKALASTTGWWYNNNYSCAIGNNPGSNNATNFSALPGGYHYDNGPFGTIGARTSWWSSTEESETYAWTRNTDTWNAEIDRDEDPKSTGFSVRCLRD